MRLAHREGISLRSAWRKVKHRRHDPKAIHKGHRGGKYFISTKRGGGHKKRYDPARRKHRRHDPAVSTKGFLGKLFDGVLTVVGGNVGGVVGPHVNAAIPQANVALGGKAYNLGTEALAVGVATAGNYVGRGDKVRRAADTLIEGFAAGLGAGADPTIPPASRFAGGDYGVFESGQRGYYL